ncbi:unnamed protein product, partial [Fusarium graminearum]
HYFNNINQSENKHSAKSTNNMKYSTATIIVLAQGIFAAPSFLNKIGHNNSKASHQSTGGDITLSIKVSQSPMNGAFHKAVKDELCWLICASDELECPDDWYSKKQGECWTCCKE